MLANNKVGTYAINTDGPISDAKCTTACIHNFSISF